MSPDDFATWSLAVLFCPSPASVNSPPMSSPCGAASTNLRAASERASTVTVAMRGRIRPVIVSSLEVPLEEIHRGTGWEVKPEGACKSDVCVPLPDGGFDLMTAAERLGWHVLWFDDSRPEESAERVRAALEPAS